MKFVLGSFVLYALARGTLQQYLDLATVSNQAPAIAASDRQSGFENEFDKVVKGSILEAPAWFKTLGPLFGL